MPNLLTAWRGTLLRVLGAVSCAVLLCAPLVSSWAQDEAFLSESDGKKLQIIARSSLVIWIRATKEGNLYGDKEFTGDYVEEIYANAGGHHSRKRDSREAIEAQLKEAISGRFDEEVHRIAAKLIPPETTGHTANQLVADLYRDKELPQQLDQAKQEYLQKHAPGYFDRIREEAVRRQGSKLALEEAYPTQEEFEDLADADWRDDQVEELRAARAGEVSLALETQDIPLLEEVVGMRDEALSAGFAEAKEQHRLLLEAVNAALESPGCVSRERIESEARRAAAQQQEARRQQKPGGRIYDLPSSVERELPASAIRLERARWIEFIENGNVHLDATIGQTLQETIRQDLVGLNDYRTCLGKILPTLFSDYAARLVAAYGARVEEKDRDAFAARLKTMVADEKEVRDAIKLRLAAEVAPPLKQARAAIAQEQFEKHFPRVADGSWVATEHLLRKYHTETDGELRSPVDVSSLETCLQLPKVREKGLPYTEGELLPELRLLMTRACQRLLAEGRTAWNSQLALVEEPWRRLIRTELAKRRSEKSLEEWIAHYHQAVGEAWSDVRVVRIWRGVAQEDLPPNADVKYSRLFGNTKDRIEAIVKATYDDLKPPEQPDSTPEPQPEIVEATAPQVALQTTEGTGGADKDLDDESGEGGSQETPSKGGAIEGAPCLPCGARGPRPKDGATGQPLDIQLEWHGGKYTTEHEVCFGKSASPPRVATQRETVFDPGPLEYGTRYYWQVNELSEHGREDGLVWSFTTFSRPTQEAVAPPEPRPAPKPRRWPATLALLATALGLGGYWLYKRFAR